MTNPESKSEENVLAAESELDEKALDNVAGGYNSWRIEEDPATKRNRLLNQLRKRAEEMCGKTIDDV